MAAAVGSELHVLAGMISLARVRERRALDDDSRISAFK